MARDTNELIEHLTRDAKPVVRPVSPPVASSLWLTAVIVLTSAAVWAKGVLPRFEEQIAQTSFLVQTVGLWVGGAAAIVAASNLAIPGHARA